VEDEFGKPLAFKIVSFSCGDLRVHINSNTVIITMESENSYQINAVLDMGTYQLNVERNFIVFHTDVRVSDGSKL
jgi:hypothetical protein